MGIKYYQNLVAYGEASQPFNIKEDEKERMITFDTKIIDLPGPTRNKLYYPVDEIKASLKGEHIQQELATGSLYGEHDHPIDPKDLNRWWRIDMSNTSFKWKKLWFGDPDKGENPNSLYGTVQTVPINGDLLYKCIKAGEFPSFSIRVLGKGNPDAIKEGRNELQDIIFITIDWVRFPGNPDSFVKDASTFSYMDSPLSEGQEYKYMKASGESAFIENQLLDKNEKILRVFDNGVFAVGESANEENYQRMKDIRLGAF